MLRHGLLILLLLGACAAPPRNGTTRTAGATYVPVMDLPVSQPPFRDVHSAWKQRLDQPYVYLDHTGSYRNTGALLPVLHREARQQGLAPSGPPFALFYDDPATVPAERLRSRACLPVAAPIDPRAPLDYDTLPSTTVIYAYIGGAYPEVPLAYPALMDHLARMGWTLNGPVRETYLVAPDSVEDYADLVTEVQLPGRP